MEQWIEKGLEKIKEMHQENLEMGIYNMNMEKEIHMIALIEMACDEISNEMSAVIPDKGIQIEKKLILKMKIERKFKSGRKYNTKKFWKWVKKPSKTQVRKINRDALTIKIQKFVRGYFARKLVAKKKLK